MTDSLVSLSPNGAAPSPFVLRPRYRWEHFDSPDAEELELYGGFAVKLRVNPTYGELQAETEALAESEDAYFALAAKRIVAWNALAADADGHETPIPAPGEHPDNDWRAVYTLERPLVAWLITALRMSHTGGEARKNLSKRFADSRARGSEPPTASDSNAPATNA